VWWNYINVTILCFPFLTATITHNTQRSYGFNSTILTVCTVVMAFKAILRCCSRVFLMQFKLLFLILWSKHMGAIEFLSLRLNLPLQFLILYIDSEKDINHITGTWQVPLLVASYYVPSFLDRFVGLSAMWLQDSWQTGNRNYWTFADGHQHIPYLVQTAIECILIDTSCVTLHDFQKIDITSYFHEN